MHTLTGHLPKDPPLLSTCPPLLNMKLKLNFLLLMGAISAFAAEPTSDPAALVPEAPKPQIIPGSYRLLGQRQVRQGGRILTFNHISEPKFTKIPAPAPRVVLTAEEQALADSRKGKAHGQLVVGATVFDHAVSEVHWTSGGKQQVVYSNIDFNLIAGIGEFDAADTVYSTLLAVGDATRAAHTKAAESVPALSEFPADLSVYLVPAGAEFTDTDKETLAALDALHAYYDANREKLRLAHIEREQKRIAHQKWIERHPPRPTDEVTFFWKKETASTVNQGGAK